MTLPKPLAKPQETDRLLPDEAIVLRVCQGETELFEILMRRHNQTVYRAIRAILRDESDVEDAMQSAYLAAFAHLERFERTARFSTWLIRIAINEAISRRRSAPPLVVADQAEVVPMHPDPKASPEDLAAARELGGWLQAAIDGLPEHYRTAVMLREVEGLSTLEVAEALEISEDVVKTRLHRARGLLRDRMETDLSANAREQFSFHAPRCDRVVAAVMEVLSRAGGR